jgi:pimeloyl-ACP methyl ester carboxylesterase
MQYVDTRAGRVAYEVAGAGAPLVLLHSAGHDHHDYDAVVPELARSFRTYAVDWPGCGESAAPRPPSSASAALMAEVLEDLSERLFTEPVVLIGNSVGGMAAIRLAGRHPEKVRAVVLVDSGGLTPASLFVRAFCWVQGREWVRRHTGLGFARSYLKLRNTHVEEILRRYQAALARPEAVAVHAALWRSFATPGNDVSAEARLLRCPVLLVWGRRDPVTRARVEGRRARALISAARYVELDTGHVPFAEDPQRFLRELLPFLQALPSAG